MSTRDLTTQPLLEPQLCVCRQQETPAPGHPDPRVYTDESGIATCPMLDRYPGNRFKIPLVIRERLYVKNPSHSHPNAPPMYRKGYPIYQTIRLPRCRCTGETLELGDFDMMPTPDSESDMSGPQSSLIEFVNTQVRYLYSRRHVSHVLGWGSFALDIHRRVMAQAGWETGFNLRIKVHVRTSRDPDMTEETWAELSKCPYCNLGMQPNNEREGLVTGYFDVKPSRWDEIRELMTHEDVLELGIEAEWWRKEEIDKKEKKSAMCKACAIM